jgi:hypothetical protein
MLREVVCAVPGVGGKRAVLLRDGGGACELAVHVGGPRLERAQSRATLHHEHILQV